MCNIRVLQMIYAHSVLRQWQKEYGDVFWLSFGSMDMYIVNGYELVTHWLRDKGSSFDGRGPTCVFEAVFKDQDK